ncbi:hypothetical protein HALDL1_00965 (plasmid) [Halobacterium sp. DL1]|nr:hypothetical protein HALDL1_00965 [Halobacterium sp. DL1]
MIHIRMCRNEAPDLVRYLIKILVVVLDWIIEVLLCVLFRADLTFLSNPR